MSKYSDKKHNENISLVKRLMIRKPDISVRETKVALENIGREFDKDYIHKLIGIVIEERTKRYDKHTKTIAVAKYEDFVRDLDATLYAIKDSKKASNRDKIFAIRSLVENQKSIMNMLMDMGILERDLGKLRADVYDVAALAKIVRESQNDPRFNTESAE
jgi:hypothetical protein